MSSSKDNNKKLDSLAPGETIYSLDAYWTIYVLMVTQNIINMFDTKRNVS